MGDMGDVFRGMQQATQERHRQWNHQNTAILQSSEFVFRVSNQGETFLFREPGKPKVDFYPSTGRWRIAGPNSQTYRGGAREFLRWFRRQTVKEDPKVGTATKA